jgi:hypothetical protein
VFFATKLYDNRAQLLCALKGLKAAIGRRQYGGLPAMRCQRGRQITHDIADAADFTTRDCAIFCGNEEDVPGVDNGVPF